VTTPGREDEINIFQTSVEGLLPTGAKIDLSYNLQDVTNFYNKQNDNEYETSAGVTLTQPILKGAGYDNTMASINLAKIESEIEYQKYRQIMLKIISQAMGAYWDLLFAQEIHAIRVESTKITEKMLADNRESYKAGRMPETEVFEVEAGLSYRKSMTIEARQKVHNATNNLLNYISVSIKSICDEIVIDDRPRFGNKIYDDEESINTAFKHRPEYIMVVQKIEQEGIRIAYAKNQRWPQLDLKASYTWNGLEYSYGESWKDAFHGDSESWLLGVEFSVPILGGLKTKSELSAANKRKKQALYELKSVEVTMVNSINNAYKNIISAKDQELLYRNMVDLKNNLHKIELVRMNSGQSNSRLVLEKEEGLILAKEKEMESFINYMKAELWFDTVEGTLLSKYGIE